MSEQKLSKPEIEYALIINNRLVKHYDNEIDALQKRINFLSKAKYEKYAAINSLLDQLNETCGDELNELYVGGKLYQIKEIETAMQELAATAIDTRD
jgi:predicted RNase H-like nuclease (RuvC/YqgF family)